MTMCRDRVKVFNVIRSVGERTLALQLSHFKTATIVTETPFLEAVKKTFEIGARQTSHTLLLAVDADVVLYGNSIKQIQEEWNKERETNTKLSRMDFLVRDKFRGRVYAGCHLYANEYSESFLAFLNKRNYDPYEKRPESSAHASFRKKYGLSSKDCKKLIVGLHDFDQYYKHIYAKYYNRAVRDRKSYQKIYGMIEEKRKNNPDDYDFIIALRAMEDANKELGHMNTDASKYRDITPLLEELGIREKEPLDV